MGVIIIFVDLKKKRKKRKQHKYPEEKVANVS